MSILGKALGHVATAKTFALNFGPWLLGAALAGAAVAAVPTFMLTKAWYQRATLRAELNLSKFETSLAAARAENLKLSQDLATAVLEKRDEDRNALDAVATGLHDLGRRVSLCASKSDVRVTVTPSGAIQAVPDGQLRDLADAVREFAVACAVQRDRDAIDHNALIDWLEGMRAKQGR